MNRILSGALCLILCLSLFWGCAKDKTEVPTETKKAPDTEEAVDTGSKDTESTDTEGVDTDGVDTENNEPEAPEDTADALADIRQAMEGTPAMMAVAYIGYNDSAESANTAEWINSLLPEFYGELSFIGSMDDSHIIGERYGELYLVVPFDANASVSVNRVDEGGEVTEVLYRSDYGEPLLVFANNTGILSDTQINIVDSNGGILTYYPVLNDLSYITQYSDGSIYDISPYVEILSREYTELQYYDWKMPETVDVVDTSWSTAYMLSDGSMAEYSISFNAGSVYIQWNEGSLEAEWKSVAEDGVCKLKLYPDTENERSFCMLLTTEHDYIYLSQDFVEGADRCDEPISVMMERTYG